MNPPEIKKNQDENIELVSSKKVSCSGPVGSLGHPKIYLDMGDNESVVCPYCSKIFKLI